MKRTRFIDRKIHAVAEYPSASVFMQASKVPQGYNTIFESGLPIDILCQYRGFDTTIVFLHGAIDTTYTLPIAAGLGVSRDVPVNRIFVTDPSLHMSTELTLGWFAGNRFQRLQPMLTDLLSKILESFGDQRVVFFGTSGGGFASLYFSAQFRDSLAIVVNPQTSIQRHTQTAVLRYTDACFDISGSNPAYKLPADITIDLVKIYSKPVINTVAYLQNATDSFHIRNHEEPFIRDLHPSNNVHVIHGTDWGEGHVAAPKEFTTGILAAAASRDWQSSLASLGFSRVNKTLDT